MNNVNNNTPFTVLYGSLIAAATACPGFLYFTKELKSVPLSTGLIAGSGVMTAATGLGLVLLLRAHIRTLSTKNCATLVLTAFACSIIAIATFFYVRDIYILDLSEGTPRQETYVFPLFLNETLKRKMVSINLEPKVANYPQLLRCCTEDLPTYFSESSAKFQITIALLLASAGFALANASGFALLAVRLQGENILSVLGNADAKKSES
jgi:hypothetical protein